jgi:hypothetical protein
MTYLRFDIFAVVTMENAVFWNMRTPCSFCACNSMELSTTREATSRAATLEILSILWTPKGSLPHSHEPFTGPYAGSGKSNSHHLIPSLQNLT